MDESSLDRILNEFEHESFLNPTLIASGHGTVENVIAGLPAILAVLGQGKDAAPLVAARYRERDSNMADHERLVFFVLFRLLNLRGMSRDVAAYLRRHTRTPHSTLAWPWHPYYYGVRALELFTGGQVHAPAVIASTKEVELFIADVEKWEAAHAPDPGKPN